MSIIIALLVLALLLGVYGSYGGTGWTWYYGWSPLFLILVIGILLYFLGVIR